MTNTSPRRHAGTEKNLFAWPLNRGKSRRNRIMNLISSVTPCLRGGCCVVVLLVLCTVGCTVGPGYKRPTAQIPDTWKGEGPWQTAAPKDSIPKGTWWQVFHDAELDRLEQELRQRRIACRRHGRRRGLHPRRTFPR